MEYLAKRLYEKYCAAVGGAEGRPPTAFNGEVLPDWETFSSDPKKQLQAAAWRAVASEAMQLVQMEGMMRQAEGRHAMACNTA